MTTSVQIRRAQSMSAVLLCSVALFFLIGSSALANCCKFTFTNTADCDACIVNYCVNYVGGLSDCVPLQTGTWDYEVANCAAATVSITDICSVPHTLPTTPSACIDVLVCSSCCLHICCVSACEWTITNGTCGCS